MLPKDAAMQTPVRMGITCLGRKRKLQLNHLFAGTSPQQGWPGLRALAAPQDTAEMCTAVSWH